MSTTVVEDVQKIEQAPADTDIRITRRIEIGSVIQQGDVYLHRVADTHHRGEQIGVESVQIALGTGNGARHVAEGAVKAFRGTKLPPNVVAPMDVDEAEILGPVVLADDTWHLTHPEHPHHRLPPGTYQTTYQYDPHTMRRVQD
jgi:hypothetical protein